MDKRLLTIQDISCVGQCSLTIALPVISACGIETSVLPSSILSNHTAKGFSGWTFRDLTDDMPKILKQWQKENITFDAFYTGYVNKKQIPYILEIMTKTARKNAIKIVDPVMADNGKLYAGFDDNFPNEIKKLCQCADVIMPNMTEAAFILGIPYLSENYDEKYIEQVLKGLFEIGSKNVILTGVSFDKNKLGIAVFDGKSIQYYFNEKQPNSSHGTGDLFASVIAGSLMNGKSLFESASLAADVVVEALKITKNDKDHWYGVKFEKVLPYLIERLRK